MPAPQPLLAGDLAVDTGAPVWSLTAVALVALAPSILVHSLSGVWVLWVVGTAVRQLAGSFLLLYSLALADHSQQLCFQGPSIDLVCAMGVFQLLQLDKRHPPTHFSMC